MTSKFDDTNDAGRFYLYEETEEDTLDYSKLKNLFDCIQEDTSSEVEATEEVVTTEEVEMTDNQESTDSQEKIVFEIYNVPSGDLDGTEELVESFSDLNEACDASDFGQWVVKCSDKRGFITVLRS